MNQGGTKEQIISTYKGAEGLKICRMKLRNFTFENGEIIDSEKRGIFWPRKNSQVSSAGRGTEKFSSG